MARGAGQKLRPLYLARILWERSDEEHPLTIREMIQALESYGIAADRKTLYDDLEALEQLGMDIVRERGRSNQYYVGERTFQLAELKLLVDVVQSARFLTPKKSGELIGKISSLASRSQARQLERQVIVTGRAKTGNEGIYYNVDALQTAIAADRKISFRYAQWVVDSSAPRLFHRQDRRGGALYQVSPWALTWDDENYYLIAYDGAAKGIRHYRVDKMREIQVLEEIRDGKELYADFDVARYTRMTFGMFGGKATQVRLRFANRLIGVVADRFGDDITIHPSGADHFTVNLEVADSPQFLGWLLSFGEEAELLSPVELREGIVAHLERIKELYQSPDSPAEKT